MCLAYLGILVDSHDIWPAIFIATVSMIFVTKNIANTPGAFFRAAQIRTKAHTAKRRLR